MYIQPQPVEEEDAKIKQAKNFEVKAVNTSVKEMPAPAADAIHNDDVIIW